MSFSSLVFCVSFSVFCVLRTWRYRISGLPVHILFAIPHNQPRLSCRFVVSRERLGACVQFCACSFICAVLWYVWIVSCRAFQTISTDSAAEWKNGLCCFLVNPWCSVRAILRHWIAGNPRNCCDDNFSVWLSAKIPPPDRKNLS